MGLAQAATGAQTCFFLEQKVHAWVMQPLTCEMQCVSPFSMQGLQQSRRCNQTRQSMANVNDNAHLTECYVLVERSARLELDGYDLVVWHVVLEAFASDTR